MKLILLSIFLISASFCLSQVQYIIVNEDSISVNDFKKIYQNNIETEGLQQAVETYVNFKLLQQAANTLHIDTTQIFKQIFEQSIKPERDLYLYNPEIKERLISEIWQNLQTDRQAEIYAIGIRNPFDIRDKNERNLIAQDLYQHICKNQSQSPQVIDFLEKNPQIIQWIRPMSISAEIERTVYKTPIGQCSKIQNSDYGKFFVKVIKERPSSGFITFDFIFNTEKSALQKAKDALNNTEIWEDVKKQYHQNIQGKKPSNIIRLGANIPEEFLVELENSNHQNISNIVETPQGFYLIQLYQKESFDNIEDWENWIENTIPQTSYALDYIDYIENRAVSLLDIKEYYFAIDEVILNLKNEFISDRSNITFNLDKPIWTFESQAFTQRDLIYETLNSYHYSENSDIQKLIQDLLPKLKKQFALSNYLANLEKHETEFAKTSHMLREAIKVNHFIEYEIYEKAERDTIGMKNYLNQNIKDFTWPERYDMEIYRYRNSSDAEIINRALKNKKSSEEIMKMFANKTDENGALYVVYSKGKIPVGHSDLPKNFNPRKKIQNIQYKSTNAIVRLNSIIKSQPMDFKEAFGSLKEIYKMYRYEETLKNLKQEANIFVPSTL